MSTYVDAHCHLDHHDQLAADEQVMRARAAGVTTLVTVGTDLASARQAIDTARRHDGVWAVVGIHPNDATDATPDVLAAIERLAREEVVVGVGETGLDYYRDFTTPPQQEQAFRQHIELARRTGKALVIHCRDAWGDCLRVLEDAEPPERVVMHCFSGNEAVVAHCVSRGWYLSFAGNVTFKNAGDLRAAAAAAPLDLLLTETDSPYLSPEPHRGKRNEPARIPHVVSQLADVHGVTVGALREQVHANARSAYDLPWGF